MPAGKKKRRIHVERQQKTHECTPRGFFYSYFLGMGRINPIGRLPIILSWITLQNQHGISKAKETISFFHRFFISRHNMFFSCQRGYEHNKSWLRQMEVCDQAVKRFKTITRINKNLSPATASL